jgi:hypothetical protein
MMPNIEQKIEEAIFVQGTGANDLDLRTPKSVNTADVENFVVDDADEFEGENNLAVENILGRAEQLASIPEASPTKAASRWKKHRAGDTDEDSLERATKLKAHRNEGENISGPLSINITDSCICSNLSCVGISIGQEKDSVDASIAILREATSSSVHRCAIRRC